MLLDLQNKYENSQKELVKATSENRRLNAYLNQILQDVEKKAETFIKQREEQEKLRNQLNNFGELRRRLVLFFFILYFLCFYCYYYYYYQFFSIFLLLSFIPV